LITGAARGIVFRLADDGYDVAVNDLPGTPELGEAVETSVNKGSSPHQEAFRVSLLSST
jgi:hypothetical protein